MLFYLRCITRAISTDLAVGGWVTVGAFFSLIGQLFQGGAQPIIEHSRAQAADHRADTVSEIMQHPIEGRRGGFNHHAEQSRLVKDFIVQLQCQVAALVLAAVDLPVQGDLLPTPQDGEGNYLAGIWGGKEEGIRLSQQDGEDQGSESRFERLQVSVGSLDLGESPAGRGKGVGGDRGQD